MRNIEFVKVERSDCSNTKNPPGIGNGFARKLNARLYNIYLQIRPGECSIPREFYSSRVL